VVKIVGMCMSVRLLPPFFCCFVSVLICLYCLLLVLAYFWYICFEKMAVFAYQLVSFKKEVCPILSRGGGDRLSGASRSFECRPGCHFLP
jgi:hypothetical protein